MNRSFYSAFPSFLSTAEEFRRAIAAVSKIEVEDLTREWRDFNREVARDVKEFDEDTNGDFGKHCVAHIDAFFHCLLLDHDFLVLDVHDQNLLLWVCLLHDISKVIDSLRTKDPFHPFASAATTIRYLCKWNWLKCPETAESLAEFIENAHQPYHNFKVTDVSKLPTIVNGVFRVCGVEKSSERYAEAVGNIEREGKEGLFELELILLVLLHQSLSVLQRYPSYAPLPDDQISLFFSKRLIHLMRIVNHCDSASYKFKNSPDIAEAYNREITERMAFYESHIPD